MLDQKQCCLVLSVLILILIFMNIQRFSENKKTKEMFQDKPNNNNSNLNNNNSNLNNNNSNLNNNNSNLNDDDNKENKIKENIESMKKSISTHNDQIKEGKKVDTILSNMLKKDGDLPTQGRMLNQIITDSNIERSKWARDFYDLKKKQENDYNRNSDILNQIVKERKDLKELIDNSKNKISQQTDKFSEGINKLGEFHNNYQKELESILKRKFDLSQDSFEINEKIQSSRLKKLKKELDDINKLKKKITGINDNESRSIKCLANGDRLNIRPVEVNGNPTGKFLVFLNDGCLFFKKSGIYGVAGTEMSDFTQHFVIHDIQSYETYNEHIDKINDGTKKLVFKTDDVVYPFKVISPLERPGECISITDQGLSIEPLTASPYQRFRTSLVPSASNCK